MTSTTHDFERMWALGYRSLLPIVPPGAPLYPQSSLAKRMAKNPRNDARGKVPGIRRGGTWSSIRDWHTLRATEADLAIWGEMGAGVGLSLPDDLVLIDADTLHEDRAAIIRREVLAIAPGAGVRIGQWPKAGYLVAVSEPMAYARVEFGEATPRERVEVLAGDRQFVALGVHPKTGKPYWWQDDIIPRRIELPTLHPRQILDLLSRLETLLPNSGPLYSERAHAAVPAPPQASLRADVTHVRAAMAALPNDASFGREQYVTVGYAVKAALPDDPEEALHLYKEWSARWTGGEDNPEIVESDFGRYHAPFRVGAPWLFEQAERLNPTAFSRADVWFDVEPDPAPTPFDTSPERRVQDDSVYPLLRIGDILSRPPPAFLIARHIPQVSVGFLYSEPGAGKSFLALDMALHIAFGREAWHGDSIDAAHHHVIYIASEGSFGFRNRIKAWMRHHGATTASDRFLMIEQTINFMAPADVDRLLRTVATAADPAPAPGTSASSTPGRVRPALVVVDTVSRSMPGADENLQKEMTLFVSACDRVKTAFGCAVLGVHHASKGGDMRGSTVLRGAGDFVFRLAREKGRALRSIVCEKQKDAPDDWSDDYAFETVDLEDAQTSLVPVRVDGSQARKLSPTVAGEVLSAMAAAWDRGAPWGKPVQTGERRAVRIMARDFGVAVDDALAVLEGWELGGVIAYEVADKKSHKSGYRVVGVAPVAGGEDGSSVSWGGIFS